GASTEGGAAPAWVPPPNRRSGGPNNPFGAVRRHFPRRRGARIAARRALFTVFALRSAVGRPPRERAKPRANADRPQATSSDVRRLSSLVKCSVSPLQPRSATPGR